MAVVMSRIWADHSLRGDPSDIVVGADVSRLALLRQYLGLPDWHRDAACIGMPLSAFFPAAGYGVPKAAKQLCADCPVKEQCLAEALARPITDDVGIWGATTARERARMRGRKR